MRTKCASNEQIFKKLPKAATQSFLLITILSFVALCCGCGLDLPDEVDVAMQSLPYEVDYNLHIRPILSDRCFTCHGPDENKLEAGLRLDLAESALAELSEHPGHYAVVPGKPNRSQVIHRIMTADDEFVMPPTESKLTLSPYDKALLVKWISDGAEYKDHWAFISPEHRELPAVENSEWVKNAIDPFILHRLEEEDILVADEADKEILLRRVTLDLTGLPPTIGQIDSFQADESPQAYEKVVDRLLQSLHYGEHMAVDWLDLARYADTHGYSVDRYRDMSPWRDWVIKAFNENMPYDQFVTWQLAGDLLPNATQEQILATGFNRNHSQNMEGGIVPEEFRVEYVSDRTNTFGKAFLGLTLECARCHDHKYDPITQEEYFQLFSFFNNVNESGQISWNNAMPVPTLTLPDAQLQKRVRELDQRIDGLRKDIEGMMTAGNEGLEQHLSMISLPAYPPDMIAHYDFENRRGKGFPNRVGRRQIATYINTVTKEVFPPEISLGRQGNGLLLNGDEALELGQIGNFDRHEPFTVSLWVHVPKSLHDGVIFHKGIGAILYNFRGYHLAIDKDRLQIMMAHTAPNNAIVEYARKPIPRDTWVQLALTYDGSSKASGYRVYMNGSELDTEIEIDNLSKTILFSEKREPGIKIGARWRGIGIKDAQVDDFMVFDRCLEPLEIDHLAGGNKLASILTRDRSRSSSEGAAMKKYFLSIYDAPFRAKLGELKKLRGERNESWDQVQEVMVMEEMSSPRPTFVLNRGAYDAPGTPVHPATPAMFSSMPADAPLNRIGLARWLLSEDHPLTARVAVNRYWQRFFGRGLVQSTDDLGSQGTPPTNPALLDYLALYFVESGWDVKALQKLIVMSATYQQASNVSAALHERDPDNVLLGRGPKVRLSGEMLRDLALASSGLLNRKIGGKSVKPYQPDGLWRMNGGRYERDTGQDLYRRSMYTLWKRTVPHPTLRTFDVPTRANCEVRRQKTSTPLQALVLLNDPTFIESSRAMAIKMLDRKSVKGAIEMSFRSLTSRYPTESEIDLLIRQFDEEVSKFSTSPNRKSGWLEMGELSVDAQRDPDTLAAYTVVASTILNSDAVLYKR